MASYDDLIKQFASAANDSLAYAQNWKEKHGRPVVGVLPMNFPAELVAAAGALPLVLQEDDEPVTVGSSRIFNFYCGYNRSLCNQTMGDELTFLDAIMLSDHCVQLLGTADVMRAHMPNVPVIYDQLVSTINAPWAFDESLRVLKEQKSQLEVALDVEITDQDLKNSIALFNKNRQLLRSLYDMRIEGKIRMSAIDVLAVVQSSMVMDRQEHTALLEELLSVLPERTDEVIGKIPVYLSGHMCHAPKKELLRLIENCGASVIADDLYTGYRFISTDVSSETDPMPALTRWYLERNKNVPCPTRSARDYDWNQFLVDQVKRTGAKGVLILLVKFCEPHMYYFPDIKKTFEQEGIPYLLIETEHEEMAMESVKTRLETFLEVAERMSAA